LWIVFGYPPCALLIRVTGGILVYLSAALWTAEHQAVLYILLGLHLVCESTLHSRCTVLKQIQNLPEKAQNVAAYLLLGAVPVQAHIHRAMFTFCNMLRNQGSLERELLIRQLCMKGDDSRSWVTQLREMFSQYHLPSAYDIAANPPSKDQVQKIATTHIMGHWFKQLKTECSRLSSMRYFNPGACHLNRAHHVWRAVTSDTREVRKATIKVKILVGKYRLQSVSQPWGESAQCPLCGEGVDTREHFIIGCDVLEDTRRGYITRLGEFLTEQFGSSAEPIMSHQTALIQLILDCTSPALQLGELNDEVIDNIEGISRALVYALHCERTKRLNKCPTACSSDTVCPICTTYDLDPLDPGDDDFEQCEHGGYLLL
jgi:hypothetical protein